MKTLRLLALIPFVAISYAEEPAKDPFGNPVQPAKPDWRRSVGLNDLQELIGFFVLKYADKDVGPFPGAFLPTDLQTTSAGIPRIPLDRFNESLHVMEFYVEQGNILWRYGFDFTLSEPYRDLSTSTPNVIFRNRQLTQYRIWRVNEGITPARDAPIEHILTKLRTDDKAEQGATGQSATRLESK